MNQHEKYALDWGGYGDHLKQAFDKMLKAKDFVDVTLSCEGKLLKAHRVILAASSTCINDILKDASCSHPTIVFRDIKYDDMCYLLSFMYSGKVEVPTKHFDSFRQTAQLLGISALMGSENGTGIENRLSTKEECKIREESESSDSNLSESNSEEANTDTELNNVMDSGPVKDSADIQALFRDKTYLSRDLNPESQCPACDEKFPSMYILKQHIYYHLGETKCQICGKVMSRMDILKKHLYEVHKIVK